MSDAQLLSIPLGGGLDESMDDAFTPPTVMRVARNVVYPTAQTATKRKGVTALATLANGRALGKRGDETLGFDGLNAWAWSPTVGAWVGRGRTPPCVARAVLPLGQGSSSGLPYVQAPLWSVAEGGGFRVSVWCDATSILGSVYDVAGKAFVRTHDAIALAQATPPIQRTSQPRVMILGTTAVAVWYVVGTGNLQAATLSLTNIAAGWSSPSTLHSITATHPLYFDVCPINGTANFGLVFADVTGAAVIGQTYANTLGSALQTKILVGSVTGLTAVAVRPYLPDDRFTYAYATSAGGGSVNFGQQQLSSLGTTIVASTAATLPAAIPAGNTTVVTSMGLERIYEAGGAYLLACTYGYTLTGGNGTAQMVTLLVSTIPTFSASAITLDQQLAYQQMSKPFGVTVNGASHYFVLAMTSDTSRPATTVLLRGRIEDVAATPFWFPVATLTPEYASNAFAAGSPLAMNAASEVAFTGDASQSVYTVGAPIVTDALECAAVMIEIDFANVGAYQSVEMGQCAYVACGTPMVYDGDSLTEIGFLHAPLPPGMVLTTGTGSVPMNPITQYVFCYAQQDALGNVHRSAPSSISAINVTATGEVALTLVNYRTTYRQVGSVFGSGSDNGTPLYIEIYRSTVTNESIYNLVARVPNDITSPTTTYTDMASDGTIASNPVLYTQTGAVAAVAAPSMLGLSVHSDRLFGIDADGLTTYYTTALEAGAAPRFADAFTVSWPDGPLTATWSLDGRFHAATASKINFMYGDGPNDNGASSDFSSPQLWQADLGVVDPRSLVICQAGVFFLSQKGLYQETRSGEFVWWGERVQRTLAANGNSVTSIVALDADGAIRVCLGGTTGTVLHYDYRHDHWSTLVYAATMASSVVANDTWWGIGTPSGGTATLYEESAASYLDVSTVGGAATWVTATLTTGWALPGEEATMQGWGEVTQAMVLLQLGSRFALTVSFFKDYFPTPEAGVVALSSAQVDAMTALPTVQFRATVPVQNAQALSVTMSDSAPSGTVGTGQGAVYQHVQIAMRAKRGEYPNLDGAALQ